jgi:protein disulfide-isomerase
MADFTGKAWCPHCIDLRKNVFETADFKAWAKKNVVLVELDFPRKDDPQLPADLAKQNEELRKKNNVGGYPTIVFFDSSGKAMTEKLVGYDKDTTAEWIAKANKILGIKK